MNTLHKTSAIGFSKHLPYRWLVVIAVAFGILMSVLNAMIINVALAKLQSVFQVNLSDLQWIVTAYLLTLAVSIPLVGYLADRFGTKRMYLLSLGVFTIGSALCGLSWNISSLVLFRVIQGLGGGALTPLGTAMVYAVFPSKQRGLASAILGVPVLLGPALGPTLGGYIVQYSDWRLIFFINVPLGLTGLVFGAKLLQEYVASHSGKFDWLGFLFSTLGFTMLLYGIANVADNGWESVLVWPYLSLSLVCLAAFTLVELRVLSPLLDIRLFKDWSFISGNLLSWISQFTFIGPLFLLSLYLQNLRGLPPFQAGLWYVPYALTAVIILPVTGVLVDRLGAKLIILSGTSLLAASTYGLSFLNLSSPFWEVQLLFIVRGSAFAAIIQSSLVITLQKVDHEALSRASSLVNVTKQVAMFLGIAILVTYAQNREGTYGVHSNQIYGTLAAFGDSFVLAALIAGMGIGVALLLPKRGKLSKSATESSMQRGAEASQALLMEEPCP
ncbi:MAG TPA: MDR family MFS transporter [Ktedonobacteraceae bacterium]|nr:MDR family MFS transporter [Ktedonobacteraceae bacterium]